MLKRYLIFGSLLFLPAWAKAQLKRDTAQTVNKTTLDVVYNQYIQDGNNSAVTGGIGTEKLYVFGPSVTIKRSKNLHAFVFNGGADIISSASTDNIDFVPSSASSLDMRGYVNMGYEKQFSEKHLTVYGSGGMSMESDYFSLNGKISISKESEDKLKGWSTEFQFFSDDLRWGRLNPNYFKPVTLVYPMELRYKQWYQEYMRYSYNLKFGYKGIINKRNTIGFFPEIALQRGLLATPFHRIYFKEGNEGVEQLPNERWKGSLAIKWSSFIGGRLIMKSTINPYVDNFGILSIAIHQEHAIKIHPDWTLLPNIRFYIQSESFYFNTYKGHSNQETFYSSDFDLSAFASFEPGIGFKYHPYKWVNKKMFFNQLILRYQWMHLTRGLNAHMITLALQTEWKVSKNK